jgi:hypothetical protein
METRYATDEKGERVGVFLDVREYERLMEALEDLADLRAADETLEAIARGEEELLPLDEAVHEKDRHKLRRYDPANLSRAPFSSFGAFSRSASSSASSMALAVCLPSWTSLMRLMHRFSSVNS